MSLPQTPPNSSFEGPETTTIPETVDTHSNIKHEATFLFHLVVMEQVGGFQREFRNMTKEPVVAGSCSC